MDHICFTMQVAPAHLAEYERMHRDAWPELLVALHESGWRNYGLFLRDDGFLVGHLETDDWTVAQAAMDAQEVSPRWSAQMDRLVVPGTRMRWLRLRAGTGGDPLPFDAQRAVAVGTEARVSAPADARAAVFEDVERRLLVAYAEHPTDARAAAVSLIADADPEPFRRVFDLEPQLAALTGGR